MATIKVYGAPWCPDCRRTKTFLGDQRVEYDWIDIDRDPEGMRFVERLQDGGHTIPTVIFEDGSHLLEPTNEEVARKLGLKLEAERSSYDLAIVGGGPAGLSAAIYAAREGIETIIVDSSAPGGQAGVAERIDNYPGFPDGIAGHELAERMVRQAESYGVELLSAVAVDGIAPASHDLDLALSTGQGLRAHAVIVATGSSYRRMEVPGEERLIGAKVHFCATCDGPFYRGAEELLVVGGGNSGLEEGLFLTQFADRVRIIDRNAELKASQLLQEKVARVPKIELLLNTQVTELIGSRGQLEAVVATNTESGEEYRWTPAAVFVFVGMEPSSEFLGGALELDEWGFIETSETFESSMAGVFAAGDVRAGSTKQVGAAVGEGIAALLMVRNYLRAHSHLSPTSVNA